MLDRLNCGGVGTGVGVGFGLEVAAARAATGLVPVGPLVGTEHAASSGRKATRNFGVRFKRR